MASAKIRQIVVPRGRRRTRLIERPRPGRRRSHAVLEPLAVGIDGTDEELIQGGRADPPAGKERLVVGHEALARVVDAPPSSPLEAGDRVVPLVRQGCGTCPPCEEGAVDLCPDESYAEHGIRGLDGFMQDAWLERPEHVVKVPEDLGPEAVLTEPLSISVKAFQQILTIQRRLPWFDDGTVRGRTALVTGVGSLGTLATLLLRLRGMEVWGLDRHGDGTAPARFLRRIGAHHIDSRDEDPEEVGRGFGGFDIVIETTGAPKVVGLAAEALAANGAMALLGLPGPKEVRLRVDETLGRLVLKNQVVLGSVNSNRGHFEEAFRVLRRAKERWPRFAAEIITHTFGPEDHERAFTASGEDVVKKVVVWDEERFRRRR